MIFKQHQLYNLHDMHIINVVFIIIITIILLLQTNFLTTSTNAYLKTIHYLLKRGAHLQQEQHCNCVYSAAFRSAYDRKNPSPSDTRDMWLGIVQEARLLSPLQKNPTGKGLWYLSATFSTITIIINEIFSLLLKYKMAFPTTLFNTVRRSLKMYL